MYISVMFNPISLRDLMYAPCIFFLCISFSSFSSFFFFAIYFKGSSIFNDFNVSFIICNFVIKHMLFRSEKFWELFHSVFMDPIVLADNLSFLIYFRIFSFFYCDGISYYFIFIWFYSSIFFCNFQMFFKKYQKQQLFFILFSFYNMLIKAPEKTLYFPPYNFVLWLSLLCIQTLSPLLKNRYIVWEDCGYVWDAE